MSQAVVSLIALALHKGFSGVFLHLAQHRASFSSLTATCLGEMTKLIVSAIIVYSRRFRRQANQYSILETDEKADEQMVLLRQQEAEEMASTEIDEQKFDLKSRLTSTERRKTLVLVTVSCLYVVQNNLYLYASALLKPTVMQVVWQLRILTTALASILLLQRRFTDRQMIGLVGLLLSVIFIDQGLRDDGLNATKVSSFSNYVTGLTAAIVAATISGFAGVLVEVVLKKESTDLWTANLQMSTYSLVPAAILVGIEVSMAANHPLQISGLDGFSSPWPWVVVFFNGLAGILVALVTKFASSVSKSFSGAFAILITFALSLALRTRTSMMSFDPRIVFFSFGNALLYLSTWLYAVENPAPK